MKQSAAGKNDPCPCGSGRKYRQCCWLRRFDTPMAKPGLLGDGGNTNTKLKPALQEQSSLKSKVRVGVSHTFSDGIGLGQVEYDFEQHQQFLLTDGMVLSVEKMQVGMQFYLDDGAVATVVDVEPPKTHHPLKSGRDAYGNSEKRVLGRVLYTGCYPRIDFVVGNQLVETTPGHLFYSVDRGRWVDAESLIIGERLELENRVSTPITYISPTRYENTELVNFEVEDYHTYFVGSSGQSAVWTHNGLGNGGCSIPKPATSDSLVGITPRQFQQLARSARRLVTEADLPKGDLVVQGSRVAGKPRETARAVFNKETGRIEHLDVSDIDIALVVEPKVFFGVAETALARARPNTRLRASMLRRIQENGQLSSFDLGSEFQQLRLHLLAPSIEHLPIQFSVIKKGGKFDNGMQVPLNGGG